MNFTFTTVRISREIHPLY